VLLAVLVEALLLVRIALHLAGQPQEQMAQLVRE
jgi:hypothetical protein